MDVSLWTTRFFLSILSLFIFISCGNRYDLSNERGRRARIDDANFYLSKQQCDSALDAIGPVYSSPYVDEEVRIIMASAYACKGGFNALTLAGNLTGASNYFNVVAKTMDNLPNDNKRNAMYNSMDVLTETGTKLNASSRTASVNTYMVYIQLGVIGTILRNYGSPSSTGAQGANLTYDAIAGTLAGEMSDVDACALAGAFSILTDSYSGSNFSDSDTAALTTSLNAVCVSAGLASCSVINKDRTLCDGTNANTVNAVAVVNAVNTAW